MKQTTLQGKHVTVTGGAGFIGSHLCEALLEKDCLVRCLDNLSTGKRENIAHLEKHPNFEFFEGDIRDEAICLKATKETHLLFHQAAFTSVSRSIEQPQLANQINIVGFLNLLLAAQQNQVERVIYATSSSVYGDSEALPKVEGKEGIPISPYAITKRTNELYALYTSKVHALPTIGLRYFNVFGERQDPNGAYAAVIPKFILQLLNGKAPVIFGDGEQTRDFTYVGNVIAANLLAATKEIPSASYPIFNIGCGHRMTLNQLTAELQKELSQVDAKVVGISIEHAAKRLGDILHSYASIDKAQKELGYQPPFDLNTGLKKTIAWFVENR